MQIPFSKYHGAGNDFVIIDDRNNIFSHDKNVELIRSLCDRHTGIGADGLILVRNSSSADFKMDYYNSDGNMSSMCGNGSRCAVVFASAAGVKFNHHTLEAFDGVHAFEMSGNNRVRVSMADVRNVYTRDTDFLLNTGSPHLVIPVADVNKIEVPQEGKSIRYSEEFKTEGVNVNFVAFENGLVNLRTYERGVEDETLACGTGCVAAAIVSSIVSHNETTGVQEYKVKAQGGDLKVSFKREPGMGFTNVVLEGPVEKVFDGALSL